MGWRLALPGLPEGYQVVEQEDGLTLVGPHGRVVAQYGPMLGSLDTVLDAAWEDAAPAAEESLQPVEH